MAIRIDAGDLVSALTSSFEERWYLDLDSGQLGPVFADSEEELYEVLGERRVRHVPALDTGEAYRIMERFADAAKDVEVRQLLEQALHGKGAFRRFKDAVQSWPDVSDAWHDFHDECVLVSAAEWLESAGIDAIIARPEKVAPKPAEPARPKVPRIGLAEMLLLGAPGGKTELIGGKVQRVFVAANAAEAQKVFADIARELHERAGLGWRRSYIEKKTSVAVDPYALRIDGHTVELGVTLEPGLWQRFG